ncbi:ParB/RepB/Spo0J family partition protein [Desulfuribacillus alkaliarsenatis]|uniref:Stage 0 sporulation protein J n=1 Tax=Desulfuribacillus alkaliarsenatis TaxID=766136 RepID=A0A1E5G2Q8_9FIRM|nr:ParB/RepB/Spo0J family partition protein [Desulfuribacillus alkaliarsenatis]OEF97321.1 stage 0 sporulation protein J [Desulfuribacillus alkaliarsenatis]
MSNKNRLGKGLSALISGDDLVSDNDQILQVDVEKIRPNPYQPRKEFNEEAINELAQSIREHGIIQPIVVKKNIRGYILIAGERRLRAAKLIGLEKIPAIEKDLNDQQMREVALIENLQREDLNPIEVADAYNKLITELNYTQEELAKRVGKSRPQISNFLRLLQLPNEIKDYVSRGTLSYGHARTLLGLESKERQKLLADRIIKDKLSVRETEEIVSNLVNVSRETKQKKKKNYSTDTTNLESQLEELLGTGVKIVEGKRKGKIEIDFFSSEDLERIINIIHPNNQ